MLNCDFRPNLPRVPPEAVCPACCQTKRPVRPRWGTRGRTRASRSCQQSRVRNAVRQRIGIINLNRKDPMEKPTNELTHQQNELTDDIIGQILEVRDTGETNMFDYRAVQRIAYDLGHFELVMFLENKKNRHDYCEFILHGKKPEKVIPKDQTVKAD